MDLESKKLMESIEGRDENGIPNAICGIHIFSVGEDPPVEVRGHSCIDCEAGFHIVTGGISEISFIFRDREDEDFLQVADVCKEFDERVHEGEECLINLVLTHDGDYGQYISAMCRTWAYDISVPDAEYKAVRFYVETEQIFEVSVPGEVMGGVTDPMGSEYDEDWIG